MITLQEAKEFLRVDGDDEENLIASLIVAAQELTEDVLRRPLAELEPLPETVRQAMLIRFTKKGKSQRIRRVSTYPKPLTLSDECCSPTGKRGSDGHWQAQPKGGNPDLCVGERRLRRARRQVGDYGHQMGENRACERYGVFHFATSFSGNCGEDNAPIYNRCDRSKPSPIRELVIRNNRSIGR